MFEFESILGSRFNYATRAVPGLRGWAKNGPVRVYKAKADGTPGKFLRIESETESIRVRGKVKAIS